MAVTDQQRQDLADRGAAGRAAQAARGSKSLPELLSDARLDVGPGAEGMIAERLAEMPQTCRLNYLKAMRGKSAAAAIKAFCQMCLGWEDFRPGIRACTDPACPLYPYRPYRGG